MHGAWAFDLLLLVFTAVATVVTFRQLAMEGDESELLAQQSAQSRRSPSTTTTTLSSVRAVQTRAQ